MPPNPVRFKANDVRRAVRVADKEGLIVSGFEILPDGTIRIHAAPPGNPSCNETDDSNVNEWDRDYGKPTA